MSAEVEEVATPRRAPRWRRALVAVLVVVGCVLAPLSMLGLWLRAELLDTDTYVSTMAPLADNEDVQQALADRITNALVVDTSLEDEVADRLPARAQFLAPKLTDAFESVVHDAALKVVQSDQFSDLWERVNERAHERVVAVLKGESSGRLNVDDGQITVDLGPITAKVNAALEQRGIDAFAQGGRRVSDNQVVLVDSVWLERAQTWTDLLQKIAYTLPILTLLCFGVAIWLSPNRRRTILRSALGVALALAVVAIGFNAGRHFYLNVLPDSVNVRAAGAVYDQLLGDLRLALRTGFVLVLVIALAAWLSGPARPATKIRDSVLGLVRRSDDDAEVSAVATFVGNHKIGLRVIVIGIGLAILVALSSPSPAAVIVIAVLVLLGILLIEFLGRTARSEQPTPSE